MFFHIKTELERAIRQQLPSLFGIDNRDFQVNIQYPANPAFGDFSLPFPFELAKTLRQAPAKTAARFIQSFQPPEFIKKMEMAGGGYINVFLDHAGVLQRVLHDLAAGEFWFPFSELRGKYIVEHTNINPNKAAHIGHLRNAILGDCLVKMMRFLGKQVEVQNYIDNTGVQVADVVVGFLHLEKMSLDQIKALPGKFDYYCWDLYARVGQFYEGSPAREQLRLEALKQIEKGEGDVAAAAEYIARRIVHCHLDTMARLGITYDVLPRESDILHLKFWEAAFAMLKESGAVVFEPEGPNAGCWVMKYEKDAQEDVKIIVRSNGTVTYTGKDIAYQLWKLGKLGRDFHYEIFRPGLDGQPVWATTSQLPAQPVAPPAFGGGDWVFNVIDSRQAYTQNVVYEGVRRLGFVEAAEHSVHFAYEMVALSPRCAEELGFTLSEEERKRPHVEVSGRRGLGVKADDLIDLLEQRAYAEVHLRNPQLGEEEKKETARRIAVGALRFFMIKFARNSLLVFDLQDALNFDGETGPYIQYSAVRAKNILAKYQAHYGTSVDEIHESWRGLAQADLALLPDDVWELLAALLKLRDVAAGAFQGREIAVFARYLYSLSHKFSNFYNRHRIIGEENSTLRHILLGVVSIYYECMRKGLETLGIFVPERM